MKKLCFGSNKKLQTIIRPSQVCVTSKHNYYKRFVVRTDPADADHPLPRPVLALAPALLHHPPLQLNIGLLSGFISILLDSKLCSLF